MDPRKMTKNDWMNKLLALKIEVVQANDDLNDLKSYLLSEKFNANPTVQVHDVLRRLENVKLADYPFLRLSARPHLNPEP